MLMARMPLRKELNASRNGRSWVFIMLLDESRKRDTFWYSKMLCCDDAQLELNSCLCSVKYLCTCKSWLA